MICAICQRLSQGKDIVQDHCHEFNMLRSQVCRTCNAMLGMARDDIPTLERAIEYLKAWRDNHERRRKAIQSEPKPDRLIDLMNSVKRFNLMTELPTPEPVLRGHESRAGGRERQPKPTE